MSKVFEIDIYKLAIQLLPTFLRGAVIRDLMKSTLQPLSRMFIDFTVFRNDNLFELSRTGQVCHLQGLLNNKFDISERRIVIEDISKGDLVYLYSDDYWDLLDEPQRVYLYDDADNIPLLLSGDSDNIDTDYSFIVRGTSGFVFTDVQKQEAKSIVNQYRLAGKLFDVN